MRSWVPAALVAALMLLAVMPAISFDSFAPGGTGDTTDGGSTDSGDNPVDTFTFTGNLECWETSAGTDSISVLIIAARISSTSSTSSTEIWYYDSEPTKYKARWVAPTEDETTGHWTFSAEVPVLEQGYSYFICVQDGYEIFRTPAFNVASESTVINSDMASSTLRYTAYLINSTGTANAVVDLCEVTNGTTTEHHMFQLNPATVEYVRGNVKSGEDYNLSNVEIRLAKPDNPDRILYTAYTNSEGDFTISNVYTGQYILTASVAGYTFDPITVDIQENNHGPYSLTMTQQSDTQYFGFDLPHFLMIVGGIICIVLIVVSILFQHRVKKGRRGDWINDDTEEED